MGYPNGTFLPASLRDELCGPEMGYFFTRPTHLAGPVVLLGLGIGSDFGFISMAIICLGIMPSCGPGHPRDLKCGLQETEPPSLLSLTSS